MSSSEELRLVLRELIEAAEEVVKLNAALGTDDKDQDPADRRLELALREARMLEDPNYLSNRREPKREIIFWIGDAIPEDYGGGALIKDETGYHLEYTYGLVTEWPDHSEFEIDELRALELEVFRVVVHESAWDALCGHGDAEALWLGVAKSCGYVVPTDILDLAKSEDPKKIAEALELYASVHGWRTLDPEPIQLTYGEVEQRWGGKDERGT